MAASPCRHVIMKCVYNFVKGDIRRKVVITGSIEEILKTLKYLDPLFFRRNAK